MRRSDRENVIGWSLVGLASALVSARPRNARWQAGHRPAVVEASLAGRALRRLGWRRVTLIACGVMVYEALRAREALAQAGIAARVVDLHTLKPLDRELIERCARETGAIVTAEEHQVNGGLGGAVARREALPRRRQPR